MTALAFQVVPPYICHFYGPRSPVPLLCAELSSGLGGDTGFCSSLGCWGIQEENGGSPGSEAVDGVEQLVCFTIRTVLIPSPGRQQLVYRENSKDTLLQHHGFPGATNSWKDQSTPRGALSTQDLQVCFSRFCPHCGLLLFRPHGAMDTPTSGVTFQLW